jgi:4-amino-4-deoxy-L-arabinose transferase-like glycosyltransferase
VAASTGTRRWGVAAGVAGLLAVLGLQLALTAERASQTWDEADHIYAGYMSWKRADFGLNPEHPPLVKLLATVPLLAMPLQLPELQNREFKHEAFLGGKDFLFGNDADTILFRTRMAAATLTLLLALLVFLAAREMFGTGAAFVALGILAFDPNLLAHAPVVATDAGLTCFMFATIYAFYRYVKSPSTTRLALVGIAAGFALAAKHTGVIVLPMLVLLAFCEWVAGLVGRDRKPAAALGREAARLAVSLAVATAIAVAVLWAFYAFRYEARPAGWGMNPPLSEFVKQLPKAREARLLSTIASWRLLPESYLFGLADVRFMDSIYTSYLFGKVYPHGVWFYFPAAFAIKSTLPFLALLALAIGAIATRVLRGWRETLFLTLPSAFHLLVAMSSRMNIGVRHILPLYAFLAVLIAGAAWALIRRSRPWACVVAALLLFHVVSSVRSFPSHMAYANELWGGPANTHRLLTDSNSDWGQQLKTLKRYLDDRGVKECWFAYFAAGVADTGHYGIPCKLLPTADSLWIGERIDVPPVVDGPVLISAGVLSGFEFGPGALNPYAQFQQLRPSAAIEDGIFVFEGRFKIPLASSLAHAQRAEDWLASREATKALPEAEQAVTLGPQSVKAHVVLGDALTALDRPDEARAAYEKALTLARTVEPEFQRGWARFLEGKLAGG